MDSIFERIQRNTSGLSNSFQKVAHYISDHYQEAAFMSAGKIASGVGVSESVVVRFALALGYSGFPEMRQAIQKEVKARLSLPKKLRETELSLDSSLDEIVESVLSMDAQNILDTARDPSCKFFPAVIDALMAAQEVYVAGFRGLSHLAGLLGFLLDLVGVRVRVLSTGDSAVFQDLRRISPQDVLILFSFARYSRRALDAMELAKQRGAKVIAVTDAITSPAARGADVALRVRVKSHSFNNSYCAAVAMINAIIVAFTVKARERSMQSLEEIERLLPESEYLVDSNRTD